MRIYDISTGEKTLPFKRISEEKIAKILELSNKGLTQKEIADEVGVSTGTVSRWIAKGGLKVKPDLTSEILARLEAIEKAIENMNAYRCPFCGYPMFYFWSEQEGPHLLCLNCGAWKQIKLPQFHKIKNEGGK